MSASKRSSTNSGIKVPLLSGLLASPLFFPRREEGERESPSQREFETGTNLENKERGNPQERHTRLFWIADASLDSISSLMTLVTRADLGLICLQLFYSIWLCTLVSELISVVLHLVVFVGYLVLLVYVADHHGRIEALAREYPEELLSSLMAYSTFRVFAMKMLSVWTVLTTLVLAVLLNAGIEKSASTGSPWSSLRAAVLRFLPLGVGLVLMTGLNEACLDMTTYPVNVLLQIVEMHELSSPVAGFQGKDSEDTPAKVSRGSSTRLESIARLSKTFTNRDSMFDDPAVVSQLRRLQDKGLIPEDTVPKGAIPSEPSGMYHMTTTGPVIWF